MRLEQLEYLRAIAKTGSINKASEHLYVSHQAISTALQSLEKELNTKLYTRTNRGVELTPDGIYALSAAEQIAEIIDELTQHFCPVKEILPSSFTIGATAALYDQHLTDTLIQYYKTYTDIPLSLVTGHGQRIIQGVQSGSIDFGLISHAFYNGESITGTIPDDVLFIPFFPFEYAVACSPFSNLAQQKSVSIFQVLEYPVLFAETFSPEDLTEYPPYQLLQHFGEVKLFPKTVFAALETLIMQNEAVTIAALNYSPLPIAENDIVMLPFKERIQSYIGIVLHRDSIHNPLVLFFLQPLQGKYHFQLPEIFSKAIKK